MVFRCLGKDFRRWGVRGVSGSGCKRFQVALGVEVVLEVIRIFGGFFRDWEVIRVSEAFWVSGKEGRGEGRRVVMEFRRG